MDKLNIKLIDIMNPGIGDLNELLTENLIYFNDLINQNVVNYNYNELKDTFDEDKRNILDFEIEPGHFYIGDKEYYLFSEKNTDVIYATNKDIPLKSYPNGYAPINLWGPFPKEAFGEYYTDELITQGNVLKSLYLNEPRIEFEESGIISPELRYPLKFDPFTPLTELYSYWNKTIEMDYSDESGYWESGIYLPCWNPLNYNYNLWENKIELLTNTDTSGFYIVEYENTSLKTLTGSSFNPITSLTREGLLVLNSEKEDSTVDYIKLINTNNQISFDKFTIIFEAYNFVGNIIKNKTLKVNLKRIFTDQNNNLLQTSLDIYNSYYNKFFVENFSDIPRQVIENNIIVGGIPEFQNYFLVKNEGLISNSFNGKYGFESNITIGNNGLGIVYFEIPKIAAKETEIFLEIYDNEKLIRSSKINNLNTIPKKSKLFVEGQKYSYLFLPLKQDSKGYYISSTEINNPSDIEIFSSKAIIENLLISFPERTNIIEDIIFDGKEVKLYFTPLENELDIEYYGLKYINNDEDFIILNSTYIYGDL